MTQVSPMTTSIYFFFFIYLFHISTALNTYTSDGISYWNSTSNFVPIQNKSYGTLKLRTAFSMQFNIIFNGKTEQASWENIFRIGHAGHSLTDFHCTKNDRFPAMWIDDTTNAFIFDVSDQSNCFRQYANYIISPNTLYTITISYNSSWIYISLNNISIVNQPRIDITDRTKLDTDIYIYISTATSIPANVILSNISILSYYDESYIPPPTNTPTFTPTYNPSISPTLYPTYIFTHPTLSPNTIQSPTKKPTTFFPTIMTTPDLLTTEEQLFVSTGDNDGTSTSVPYYILFSTTLNDILTTESRNDLSFEVIFYILTGCAMGGILFCVCTCCCFGCIINKKIKTLAEDEVNMYDDKNKIRLQTFSNDTSESIVNITSSPTIHTQTESPINDLNINNYNQSSPSSVMSTMSKSFNSPTQTQTHSSSPNTLKSNKNIIDLTNKFIKRSTNKKTHLSPKNSNNSNSKNSHSSHHSSLSNRKRINTKMDMNMNEHTIAIQRNDNIIENDIGFMNNEINHPKLNNINTNDTEDTTDDCKIISSTHSLLSPLRNSNHNNNNINGILGNDGYERGHFYECRNINNINNINNNTNLKKISQFSGSTNYSLYVHSPVTIGNNMSNNTPNMNLNHKYISLQNNGNNIVNNIQNNINPQYQIQIDYVNTSENETGENNINNSNESDGSTDSDSDSSSNNNNNNIQYSTDELYEMKSLGNIEMESQNNKLQKLELELETAENNINENSIENECEAEEDDMKNETIMNTNSTIIGPTSVKSFKSFKSSKNPPITLTNNMSSITETIESNNLPAKAFLQLPRNVDSQMSADSVSSNQSSVSCSSNGSNSSSCSNSSNSSSSSTNSSGSNSSNSSYSQSSSSNSNSNSASCSSHSHSHSHSHSSSNSSQCSSNSNSSQASSNANANTDSKYSRTQYTITTNTNQTPINAMVVNGGNNVDNDLRSNISQSTAYYANTQHSL